MVGRLKTYQTSPGFFDLAIAAPSMKAAAEAWGLKTNEFKRDVFCDDWLFSFVMREQSSHFDEKQACGIAEELLYKEALDLARFAVASVLPGTARLTFRCSASGTVEATHIPTSNSRSLAPLFGPGS